MNRRAPLSPPLLGLPIQHRLRASGADRAPAPSPVRCPPARDHPLAPFVPPSAPRDESLICGAALRDPIRGFLKKTGLDIAGLYLCRNRLP